MGASPRTARTRRPEGQPAGWPRRSSSAAFRGFVRGGPPGPPLFFWLLLRPVERRREELGVFLGAALEAEEVVVAAAVGAGVGAADVRPGFVDGAAPGFAVDELADGAVDLVRLVPEDGFSRFLALLGKLPRDELGRQIQIGGQPAHVGVLHRDARIGAAVRGTAVAAVEIGHGEVRRGSLTVSKRMSTPEVGMNGKGASHLPAALLLAPAAWAAAPVPEAVLQVPESITAQGVPPIPARNVADLLPYENIRTANFADWHPKERRLLIRTRFAESPQLHEVAAPMGARTQLTFYRDPITEGLYRPGDPDQVVYSFNEGGAENSQFFLLDRRTGKARRFSGGAHRPPPPASTATSRRSGRATASSSPTRTTPATARTWTSTSPIPRRPAASGGSPGCLAPGRRSPRDRLTAPSARRA